MKLYQNIIHSYNDNVNPALVESYMKSIYGTLDSLPLSKFAHHANEVELNEESVYEAVYGNGPRPANTSSGKSALRK